MLKNQLEQLKKGNKDEEKPGDNTQKKGENGQGQIGSEGQTEQLSNLLYGKG